jgi:dihydrofolate reductase
MATLIYSTIIASLDGYIADEAGNFDWAAPDEEVHASINDLARPIGTYLCGRRMYEVMVYWETIPADETQPAVVRDFAQIWRAADKIVYSKTLQGVASARTRLEREFDLGKLREMKERATRDMSIGGPHLAAQAIRAGLVDEYQLFVVPYVAGGGNRALPKGAVLRLELLDERRFASGFVYLRYATTN